LRFGLQVQGVGKSSIQLRLTARVGAELRAKIDQTVVLFSLENRCKVEVPAELKQKMLRFAPEE
jgi:4-hydroxybenzoyl-CoA thioesterase